jgi:hypothetical protein
MRRAICPLVLSLCGNSHESCCLFLHGAQGQYKSSNGIDRSIDCMSAVCIRCGSKEHSTRDHDEGKVAGLAAPKKPPPKKAAPPPQNASGTIQHAVCWKSIGRRPGIPDIVDKPLYDRWSTPAVDDPWFCNRHANCPCMKCEKKKAKLALEALRRQGKA